MNSIKMLYYYKIDDSERTDVNKIYGSQTCDICHYLAI